MNFIKISNENNYLELNKEKMLVYNFLGGHHPITQEELNNSEIIELNDWHELYCSKHYCPLETDKYEHAVWISPEGKFYQGNAHEVQAEDLCEIIYGEKEIFCAGDYLEEHGWIRAARTFMWEIRFDEMNQKQLTQKQYDALYDWCECNRKTFPNGIQIK